MKKTVCIFFCAVLLIAVIPVRVYATDKAYENPLTGIRFVIPDGWHETDPAVDDGKSMMFVPDSVHGPVMGFSWDDLWGKMSPEQKNGISRTDVTTTYFSPSELRKLDCLGVSQASLVDIDGVEYYRTLRTTSSYSVEYWTHVENGYVFLFQALSRTEIDYPSFMKLLESADYSHINAIEYDETVKKYLPQNIYFGWSQEQVKCAIGSDPISSKDGEDRFTKTHVTYYNRHPAAFDPENKLQDYALYYVVFANYNKSSDVPQIISVQSEFEFVKREDVQNVIDDFVLSCYRTMGRPYYSEKDENGTHTEYYEWSLDDADLLLKISTFDDHIDFSILVKQTN